jgi:acetylornithine deacetylase/succinyl-diaminopimelate desuccinylase-like protein
MGARGGVLKAINKILTEVDRSKNEIVELLQELVRIPTINTGTMPTGNEIELCKFLKKKFDAEGITSEVVESEPTRGNFIARLNGQDDGKAKLMFMSHTDVVPIGDESKWIHPPFSGTLDDGRVYGRGADDCKSMVACEAMAMILLKRMGIPLKRSLIFAAGCDEETGSKFGFHWLAKNNKQLIESEFAINEAGGEPLCTPKGLCFTVALGEKGRLDAKINFKGKSCHAAIPWEGENALVKMADAIQKIKHYQAKRDTSAVIFREIPRLFDLDESEITPDNVDEVISKIYEKDKSVGSMLRGLSRMTITPTMASGGVKSNVIPDLFTLTCDVRVLPGQSIDYVKNELNNILNDIEGYDISASGTIPIDSPSNDEFLQAIKASLITTMGESIEIMPTLTIGLTDSCAVRPLGTIVYNFAPTRPDSDPGNSNVHGDNESISVEDIVFRTKVLVALACNLLT